MRRAPRALGRRAARADRGADVRHDARDERDRGGQDGAHGVLHDRGLPRHPAGARGRQARPVQADPVPAPVRARAGSRSRSASAWTPRASRSSRSTRPRVVAAIERARELGVEAIAVCLLWSIVNPAHEQRVGELIAAAPAGRAVHALARAQPDHPRVPARLVDRHRRVAEAAHAGVPLDDGERPARGRLRGPPADRDVVRRRLAARPGGRAADLLGRLRPVDGARRGAHVRARRVRRGGGRRPRRLRHGRDDVRRRPHVGRPRQRDRRDVARRALDRAHHRASARSTSSRSAPAAARSSGSTRAACCASGRSARAPIPALPATAAAAPSRRSPTPPSCSAGSTPPTSWAAC